MKPLVCEQGRIDAVCEIAQFLEGVVHGGGQGVEHMRRPLEVGVKHRPREFYLDTESDDMLLSPIVKVALDLAAGLVRRRNGPPSRSEERRVGQAVRST